MNHQSVQEAVLNDGTILKVGDEVTANEYHKSCHGNTFIVCEIYPYKWCWSKFMVVVHLKGDPARKITGFKKEGIEFDSPPGIDASYFKKI